MKIRAIKKDWKKGEITIPAIRIFSGPKSVIIPVHKLKDLLFQLHDLYEKENKNG